MQEPEEKLRPRGEMDIDTGRDKGILLWCCCGRCDALTIQAKLQNVGEKGCLLLILPVAYAPWYTV